MNDQTIDNQQNNWTDVILPKRSLFDLRLKDVWVYRDLLVMFVKRDYVANYKQTVLGPLWYIIQPIFTTIMYTVVFGRFAKISTEGQPRILFYMAGVTIWNYFSDSFNRTSAVFTTNANIFGKVYFPRLIMPLYIVISSFMKFGIQFMLFIVFLIYFFNKPNSAVHPNAYALLTPFLLLLMAGFALGAGMIISSITTKYRDFKYLITFAVSLLMYATPIIYPISFLPHQYQKYVFLNPISGIVEAFRFGWLGSGAVSWGALTYSTGFMLFILFSGLLIFNKVEKNFMDTV